MQLCKYISYEMVVLIKQMRKNDLLRYLNRELHWNMQTKRKPTEGVYKLDVWTRQKQQDLYLMYHIALSKINRLEKTAIAFIRGKYLYYGYLQCRLYNNIFMTYFTLFEGSVTVILLFTIS